MGGGTRRFIWARGDKFESEFSDRLWLWPSRTIEMLVMKTTSNGRQPQNIKRGIPQQPLIQSFSIF